MKNFGSRFTALAIGATVALANYPVTVSADAFEGLSMMRMGAWEVDFSGNANAFVVSGDCDGEAVAGGLACAGDQDYGDIRTGLLPSWFNFSASTMSPGGWKTGAHLSFQPGADDGATGLGSGGLGGPLGLNSSNFRQIFATLSHENYGTFKIGRDLGVFGSNAILEDMTLLGVGAPGGIGGGNTTLGRIGFGYIYADWKAQLQYTTPDFNGFSATVALVDPWAASSIAGGSYSTTHANRPQEADTYGLEGKLNYAFDGGHVWASFITQEVQWIQDCATGRTCVGDNSPDATAFDIGGKLVMNNFDLVAYYYDGEGLGTTDFMLDGFDYVGEERDSDGYYLQGRWRTPMGTLLGISYGESELDETRYDRAQRAANDSYALVESNELLTIGVYHPVGEGMNLVAEYSNVESEAHNGNSTDEDVLSVGAIIFF